MLREEPTPREVAHHVPHVPEPDLAPRAPELALGVEAPDRRDVLGGVVPDDVADWPARVAEPAVFVSPTVYGCKG